MKLTDEQLAVLPERAQNQYAYALADVRGGAEYYPAGMIVNLCHELARALAPMPCGHPGAAVVSAPSAEGMDTTSSCGWCDEQAHDGQIIEAMRAKLAVAEQQIAILERCENIAADTVGILTDRLSDCQNRLAAAEGLATVVATLAKDEKIFLWAFHEQDKVRAKQALAAWREAANQ